MMANNFEGTMQELSAIQRQAVEWEGGPLLVLAGPGSGKARMLACRVARVLRQSPKERFRVLVLAPTNKAAHEVAKQVTALVPGRPGQRGRRERAYIHTFHDFCTPVLQQHGSHLGINPNFAIYSDTSDRQAVLDQALKRGEPRLGRAARRLLPRIDALKARLVEPSRAEEWAANRGGAFAEDAEEVALAYCKYEDELRRANALDLNSLVLEAFKLFAWPVFRHHYRTLYRHWLINDVQDLNDAQFRLLRRMAGDDFQQLLAVADDAQAFRDGDRASVRRIRSLVGDLRCEVVQLPTNYRCPAPIVEAGNRLLVYNVQRRPHKKPAQAARPASSLGGRHIEWREFSTDWEEATGIAAEIAALDAAERAGTLVLARTRALLEPVQTALGEEGVAATLLARRDDFVSPQTRWLVACLRQIARPLDRRNMAVLLNAFRRFAPASPDLDDILVRSEEEGVTLLSAWTCLARTSGVRQCHVELVDQVANLAGGRGRQDSVIEQIVETWESGAPDDSLADDIRAWRRLEREIRQDAGRRVGLDRFLQELELRSKEPPAVPGAVSLATIHGAKGLEFERVHVIGMVEGILPSWHSVNAEDDCRVDEERRACFVAVTRTRQRLVLSWARRYAGWQKDPSRFLAEMGIVPYQSGGVWGTVASPRPSSGGGDGPGSGYRGR